MKRPLLAFDTKAPQEKNPVKFDKKGLTIQGLFGIIGIGWKVKSQQKYFFKGVKP
ncbi:MAG: hypothetical protein IJW71_06275 [Clostridia bacterium]|nr:hypothetical protein [Clostridia bacterium]